MRTGDRNCIRSINYKKQDDKSSGWSDLAAAFYSAAKIVGKDCEKTGLPVQ